MLKKILAAVAALMLCTAVHAQATLTLDRDAGGFGSYTPMLVTAPTYVNAYVLLANTSQTAAVPSTDTRFAIFSSTCNFYAKPGASAAVPGASATDGTAPMLNPAGWGVRGITQITLVAGSGCTVTVSFYK